MAQGGDNRCGINMAGIHLLAGDLAGAYRENLPGAEGGDPEAIALMVDICERAGDPHRAAAWRERLEA